MRCAQICRVDDGERVRDRCERLSGRSAELPDSSSPRTFLVLLRACSARCTARSTRIAQLTSIRSSARFRGRLSSPQLLSPRPFPRLLLLSMPRKSKRKSSAMKKHAAELRAAEDTGLQALKSDLREIGEDIDVSLSPVRLSLDQAHSDETACHAAPHDEPRDDVGRPA